MFGFLRVLRSIVYLSRVDWTVKEKTKEEVLLDAKRSNRNLIVFMGIIYPAAYAMMHVFLVETLKFQPISIIFLLFMPSLFLAIIIGISQRDYGKFVVSIIPTIFTFALMDSYYKSEELFIKLLSCFGAWMLFMILMVVGNRTSTFLKNRNNT